MDIDKKLREEGTKRFAQLSQVDGGCTHEVVCLGDDKPNANIAGAEGETKGVAQLSRVREASIRHESFEDENVNTNSEEDESHPKTSAQKEPSFADWILYLS
ncbi:hypothetical protein FNV43_RR10081 [Rhamnella rubrinervis]|uniref:Uncharacterized protein n=1 Tax=Rhamnella rubrinervis TaxID=2594499 RepID=A0A8K0HCJ5_9ROSA|nr:hypothetical protein FNV43_RR10081 [Rhamnella rubrinervis]